MNRLVRDEDGFEDIMQDPIEVYAKAIKVHTKETNLNEDATLAKLDAEMPKLARYVTEQTMLINIIKTFLKSDVNILRRSNELKNWGKLIEYVKPEQVEYEACKTLLNNKVHSVLILSRSVKGMPLKSFLTYGREAPQRLEEHKRSMLDKALGRNKEPTEEVEDY